jgi:hypothetical protein
VSPAPPTLEYLNDWARPDVGWLRKYYTARSDEPHFDARPAVEKALSWLRSLEARSFSGTESRLNTLVERLRQITSSRSATTITRLDRRIT